MEPICKDCEHNAGRTCNQNPRGYFEPYGNCCQRVLELYNDLQIEKKLREQFSKELNQISEMLNPGKTLNISKPVVERVRDMLAKLKSKEAELRKIFLFKALDYATAIDKSYDKIVSNIQEVKARNGIVIAVVTEGDKMIRDLADHVLEIPHADEVLTSLLAVVPLQLLSYHIAVMRGCNVDQPRNLAKSVTVE